MPDLDEFEIEGQDPVVDQAKGRVVDEDDVVVDENDPLYAQPNWKEDPAKKLEAEDDKEYGKRVQKRIGEITAAGREAIRQRDQYSSQNVEMAKAYKALTAKVKALEERQLSGNIESLGRAATGEKSKLESANKRLKAALTSGNVDEVAEATMAQAEASANYVRFTSTLEDVKRAKEARPKVEEDEDDDIQPVRQQRQVAVPDARQNWFDNNPWLRIQQDANGNVLGLNDLSKTAVEAHQKLINAGYTPDSPEYFQEIDKSVRSAHPAKFGLSEKTAPVPLSTRSAGAGSSSAKAGSSVVRLSRSQYETAKSLGFVDEKDKKKTNAQLKAFYQEIKALEAKEGK